MILVFYVIINPSCHICKGLWLIPPDQSSVDSPCSLSPDRRNFNSVLKVYCCLDLFLVSQYGEHFKIKLGAEKFFWFVEIHFVYFWQLWFLLQIIIISWLDLVLLVSFHQVLARILFLLNWSVLTSGSLLELWSQLVGQLGPAGICFLHSSSFQIFSHRQSYSHHSRHVNMTVTNLETKLKCFVTGDLQWVWLSLQFWFVFVLIILWYQNLQGQGAFRTSGPSVTVPLITVQNNSHLIHALKASKMAFTTRTSRWSNWSSWMDGES